MFDEPQLGLKDVEVRFDEMSMLEWRAFVTQFEGRPNWLCYPDGTPGPVLDPELNLTMDVLKALIKPRLPKTPPRTQDVNIFAPKGMGKSYLMGNLLECGYDYLKEEFNWSTWFMSPTQFLMFAEKASEEDISNKFLAIDEPRIRERGEGSGSLWNRFMDTRATIRPRRSSVVQASERYVSTNPNLILKPVYLDERNSGLLTLVMSPDGFNCYGHMLSGPPSKRWSTKYDELRLDFERRVRQDKSEARAYWEPIALGLIEKYHYAERQSEIDAYNAQMADWAEDKKLPKPRRPAFMNQAGQLSESRIVQDARYEKKLSSTEYVFLAGLVADLLKSGVPVPPTSGGTPTGRPQSI